MAFCCMFTPGLLLWASVTGWLDVPYVRQLEEGCGAASIAMVMQYWSAQGASVDRGAAEEEAVYRALAPAPGVGSSGQSLKRYLEGHGFEAYLFDGEVSDLQHHLDKGRPVIVCLAPRGLKAQLHYVVVVGLTAKAVMLHDPVRGKLTAEDRGSFERQWKATGDWALLAVPWSAAASGAGQKK